MLGGMSAHPEAGQQLLQILTAFAAPGRLDLDLDSLVGRSSGTKLAEIAT
jgi:hypothetical protein